MGEVYRADDLTLGHTVALKFLPRKLDRDAARLEAFRREVRLSRQIAHPNVCRVYDIGEVDGQHFLSMEYVDGEDLGVLLRRIDHLPQDKGLQIARQLCAGLAAAHEKGVLHRDLKPANIMLDGRGQVRITDFGLARIAAEDTGGEISGTPAYMAPEQLTRGETSVQSDLYALGLILHELFTGKAVFGGRPLADILRAHQESVATVAEEESDFVDATVARVIVQCLEPEPVRRPASAHAVAAALPGGDPLAAALAAGETPSPGVVAAAGITGKVSLRAGVAGLALVLLGLFLSTRVVPLIAPGRSGEPPGAFDQPAKLAGDLRDDLLEPLGYYDPGQPPDHVVHGLHLERSTGGAGRLEFWYRQRDEGFMTPVVRWIYMGPAAYAVSMSNPSVLESGMTSARTDMQGALIEFLAVLKDGAAKPAPAALDDRALFSLAGLEWPAFKEIPDQDRPADWTPPVYADQAVVYRDTSREPPLGVISARQAGRLVYWYAGPIEEGRFVGRWLVNPGERPLSVSEFWAARSFSTTMQLVVLVVAIVLALRNLRMARADRRGATCFAGTLAAIQLLLWLSGIDHVLDYRREVVLFRDFLWVETGYVFRLWIYYLALEPYVRRYWPDVLIGWTRLLAGRFRDPLPGREVLVGSLAGLAVTFLATGIDLAALRLGAPAYLGDAPYTSPSPGVVSHLLATAMYSLTIGIWFLMVLLMLRALLKRPWAVLAAFMLFGMLGPLLERLPWSMILGPGVLYAGFALAVTRSGLVTGITLWMTFTFLKVLALTPDLTAWHGRPTLIALGGLALLAGCGFFTSTVLPGRARQAGPPVPSRPAA
jgi:hypothetical protein